MSKEFKNMDDLFQSAFADEGTEVPAFVKKKIDKKLFGGKKKFGSLLPSIFMVALVTGGIIYFNSNDDQTLITENIPSEKNSNTTLSGENEINSTANSSENNIDNSINNPNNSSVNSTNQNLNDNSNHNNVNSASQKNSHTRNNNGSGTPVPDAVINFSTNQPTLGTSGIKSNFDVTLPLIADNNSEKKTGDYSITNDANAKNENPSLTENNSENNSGEKIDENNSENIQENYSKENIQENNDSDSAKKINPEIVTANNDEQTDPSPDIIEKEEKYSPWMFSLTAGMNVTKSNYVSPIPGEEDLYSNFTNDKPGFETNFDAKYRLNNSMTFGSGLGLTQFVENYSFSKNVYTYDSTLTWSFEYDSLDTSAFPLPIDSSYTTSYDTTQISLYDATGETKATYIHVPISFGTQIIHNKFRFDFFVLARFNFLVGASGGYILNDAYVSFTKNNNPIFKPWYIDMMLGAAIHYNLIGNLYFSGTIRYRPPFGQMYQGTSFNRTLQYTHFGFGLSLKL